MRAAYTTVSGSPAGTLILECLCDASQMRPAFAVRFLLALDDHVLKSVPPRVRVNRSIYCVRSEPGYQCDLPAKLQLGTLCFSVNGRSHLTTFCNYEDEEREGSEPLLGHGLVVDTVLHSVWYVVSIVVVVRNTS